MGLEILVADDEALIRMGLRAMLEEMGHRVTLAVDGREALRLARQRAFDLAILDIKMPKTDGLQAAQALSRATPLPVIFLTAYSETDLVEEATDLPVHGYLVKPVQPEQLAAAIAVARKRFAEAHEMERQAAGRRLVTRAKERLMAGGMSEPEAHRLLQQRARESRRKLADVAQEVLDSNK
jgi:two-component system, response regulator PdtaR